MNSSSEIGGHCCFHSFSDRMPRIVSSVSATATMSTNATVTASGRFNTNQTQTDEFSSGLQPPHVTVS